MNSTPLNKSTVFAVAIGAATSFAACSSMAQSVVFDGTMGPTGSLSGDMVISNDYGTQVGANLFHSFTLFNVLTGESATFTSNYTGATHNVIARVTGGGHSMIDGSLVNAIPGANLWLINPGGVAFGPNAEVDVQGSFHVSTADYLLLDDGGRFSAQLDDASGTILTMGNPTTFGFLGPTAASIGMNGSVTVPEGQSISLTAGDINLNSGTLLAPGGTVSLTAISGAGEVRLSDTGPTLSGFDGRGSITLEGGAGVDVSSEAGGSVFIHGGQFLMTGGSVIDAGTNDQDGGAIAVDVDSFEMRESTTIQTRTTGDGRAGDIDLQANGDVTLTGGSQVTSISRGDGSSGDITLTAGGQLLIGGWDSTSNRVSALNTDSKRFGENGSIDVEAGSVILESGGQINSASSFWGDSGDVRISSTGAVVMRGVSNQGASSGIYADNLSRGNAGDVDISAANVTIVDGGFISAGSSSTGDAGHVTIETTGDVTIGSPAAASLWISGISVENSGAGDSGTIEIDAQNFFVLGNTEIILRATRTQGGAPGLLTVTASDLIRIENSSVFAEGFGAGASSADITLTARAIEMNRGFITNTTVDTDGSAGTISLIASDYVTLSNESEIGSASRDGTTRPGADIVVITGSLELSENSSLITNTFDDSFGAGSIFIQADELRITDSSIEAEACSCSTGNAGDITINISGTITISGLDQFGDPAGIRSRTFGSGRGGNITITADSIRLSDQGAIYASSVATQDDFDNAGLPGDKPGAAGSIVINANLLDMQSGASITALAVEAAGGSISLNITDFIYLTDSEMTAEAQGVTPDDDGGNVTITGPTAIVMNHSAIRANANAGNGGNINIATEVLVPSVDSVLDASSQTGVDGQVVIDSPNQAVSSVALLETPVLDVAELVQDPCEVDVNEQRSSLTVEGQGGLRPAPDDFQSSPPPELRRKTSAIPPGRQSALAQEPPGGQCEEAGP